jgi:hypothetical protein
MSQQIRYKDNGDRTYYIDGVEVTEKEFFPNKSSRLSDMLSEQRAPHGVSDCTFMKDTANGKQFQGQEQAGNHYREVAESLGASVTGKKYIAGLANFPGDPEAWVDSRGDAQRLLEKRGWGSEGTINVKARESAEPPKAGPEVAEDLLDKYTNQIADAQPMPHLVDRADLREQVKERIKPKKHKKANKSEIL